MFFRNLPQRIKGFVIQRPIQGRPQDLNAAQPLLGDGIFQLLRCVRRKGIVVRVPNKAIRCKLDDARHILIALLQPSGSYEYCLLHTFGIQVIQPELAGFLDGIAFGKRIREPQAFFPLILLEFIHLLELFHFSSPNSFIFLVVLTQVFIFHRKMQMRVNNAEFLAITTPSFQIDFKNIISLLRR